jgi:membrane-associated protease RseP (regulator of RpoE activity)
MGPGEAFGVAAYQCASCGIKQEGVPRPEYSFNAEPVVLQTEPWTPLRAGDVIEAVNGKPITTRAGADQFTYPPNGESVVTVRRSGTRAELRFAAREKCNNSFPPEHRIQSVEVLRGHVAVQRYGVEGLQGVIYISTRTDSASATRTTRPSTPVVRPEPTTATAETSGHGRYGFAISCVPSCTRVRASDGTDYWKFDGEPPIAGIMPGSPAALAGLRVGDIVKEIDGISILSEDGALRFQRSERKESLHVTVLRDGTKVSYLLRPR